MDLSFVFDFFAHKGFAADSTGMFVLRAAVGVFFAISGYHKLFHPVRRARFINTLKEDGIPALKFNSWWVPGWEFAGGVMLTVGLFTIFNAIVLMVICLVACHAEAATKVARFQPIDFADKVDDYLYLPEVLYLVMLAAIAFAGSGVISLDHLLFA